MKSRMNRTLTQLVQRWRRKRWRRRRRRSTPTQRQGGAGSLAANDSDLPSLSFFWLGNISSSTWTRFFQYEAMHKLSLPVTPWEPGESVIKHCDLRLGEGAQTSGRHCGAYFGVCESDRSDCWMGWPASSSRDTVVLFDRETFWANLVQSFHKL